MAESEKKFGLSRRKFIKYSAVTAVGIGALGVKFIGFKESQGFTIPEEELLKRIYERPDKKFHLGLYPNSYSDLKSFSHYVGQNVMAGTFATEVTFRNRDRFNKFVEDVETYTQTGAKPLLTVGQAYPFNNLHPFDKRNEKLLINFAEEAGDMLNVFPFEIGIRLFIEPEFDSFCYGTNHGLPQLEHEERFRRSFAIFATILKEKRKYPTKIHFSPWVDTPPYDRYPIDGYFPGNENIDGAGVDGYDFYTGAFEPFDRRFWKWTPEETYGGTVDKLLRLTGGKKSLYIYEAGSARDNSQWLKHAVFYAMSIPQMSGFFHFGIDKRIYKDKVNWAPSLVTIKMYGDMQKLIRNA